MKIGDRIKTKGHLEGLEGIVTKVETWPGEPLSVENHGGIDFLVTKSSLRHTKVGSMEHLVYFGWENFADIVKEASMDYSGYKFISYLTTKNKYVLHAIDEASIKPFEADVKWTAFLCGNASLFRDSDIIPKLSSYVFAIDKTSMCKNCLRKINAKKTSNS